MSEEEIIKELKRIYRQLKFDDSRGRNSIFEILDLYNKEKEQNSLIKEKLKELNIPMETLIGEFNRLEDLEDDTIQLKCRLKEEREHNEKLEMKLLEKDLHIDGLKEDRRIAVEEIKEEYFVSKEKLRETLDKNSFEINTKEHGNIEVINRDDIQELLEEK